MESSYVVSVKVSCAKARGSYLNIRHVSSFDSTSKMLHYWVSIWPTSCQNTHNVRSSAENFFNKNKFYVLFSVVVAIVALYIRLTRYKRMESHQIYKTKNRNIAQLSLGVSLQFVVASNIFVETFCPRFYWVRISLALWCGTDWMRMCKCILLGYNSGSLLRWNVSNTQQPLKKFFTYQKRNTTMSGCDACT